MDYAECVERTRRILPTRWDNELHMVLGMLCESGELADNYKAALAYGKPLDNVNLKEELGDILWFLQGMCNINGWTLKDIMELNVNKLVTRYPDKFTVEKAMNRDLDEERRVLENGVVSKETEDRIMKDLGYGKD
jgi:NTP pyrophosphatase (non-canonical NTP hydrolase)